MALPQKIQVNAITGASLPSTIDNDINTGIKQPVIDILGIPDNTNIAAALMEVVAAGLKNVRFQDAAGDPGTAGYLQRNAANLLFHDGTAARTMVSTAATQTLTGKTLTSPIIGTQVTLDQTTGDYTVTWADPAAGRAISVPDPGGTDVFVFRDMTQTLLGKTLTSPTLTTPVITSPTINSKTITSPAVVLTGDIGTIAVFQQTAAPTGWTKVVTQNDKTLRVVSGAAGTGGATAFSSVFGAGKVTGSHVLTTAEIAAHTHTIPGQGSVGGASTCVGGITPSDRTLGPSNSTGGDGGHTHTLSLDLQFVDIIFASKD